MDEGFSYRTGGDPHSPGPLGPQAIAAASSRGLTGNLTQRARGFNTEPQKSSKTMADSDPRSVLEEAGCVSRSQAEPRPVHTLGQKGLRPLR